MPHATRELSPFSSFDPLLLLLRGEEGLPFSERERIAAVDAGDGLTSRGVLYTSFATTFTASQETIRDGSNSLLGYA